MKEKELYFGGARGGGGRQAMILLMPMIRKMARVAYIEGFNKGYDCCDAVDAHEASVSDQTAEMCFKRWAKLFFKGNMNETDFK